MIFEIKFLKERTFIYICNRNMRVRDENKECLVRQKALEMLVEKGFDGFSMQKLAKEANVSPATLYIYFKDKDDLIVQLGLAEGTRATELSMQDFDPYMPFEEGMRIQWRNRAKYWIEYPLESSFFEQLKHSPFRCKVMGPVSCAFKEKMTLFCTNAIKNKELSPMPVEVYWSIAFSPLYTLLRFHQEGKSLGDKDFTISEEIMNQTLERVLKALRP